MQDDILVVDIPQIQVEYDEYDYSYTRKKGRENLQKTLYRASRQYCMYCYTRIQIDERKFGHLEHAVERSISPVKLTNCIPNIGLACGYCNSKYKKVNEKARVPEQKVIEEFEKDSCQENCKNACVGYLNFRKNYLAKREAHIILQPIGVTGEESGEQLLLQYDILEARFIPAGNKAYTLSEKNFIEDHINRFHLNAKQERTKQLIRFIEDTLEHDGEYAKIEYNSLIVELFVEQILKGKTQKDIMKICKLIYSYSFIKFNT